METALCVLLCVSLCGMAAVVSGVPIGHKITPSPRWMMKTKYLAYPHKRLSRPWLNKVHEELWMEIPSGDGPQPEWSVDIPRAEASSSETEYQTRSPVPEDFSSEIFPTVIDTETEELESYDDSLVSRFSMTYDGPSSLLNTFVFQPSIHWEFTSFHLQTPSFESVPSIAQGDLDLSASWPGKSNREDFEMKVKRTATSLNDFSMITATYTSHIYQEKSRVFTTETLEISSNAMTSIENSLLSKESITVLPMDIKSLGSQSLSIITKNIYPSHVITLNSNINLSQSLDMTEILYQTDIVLLKSSNTVAFPSSKLLSNKTIGSSDVLAKSFDSISQSKFLKYESLDVSSTKRGRVTSDIIMTLDKPDSGDFFRSESFYQPSSFVFYHASTSTFQNLVSSELDIASKKEYFDTVHSSPKRTLTMPLISTSVDPPMTENEVEAVIQTPPTEIHFISLSISPISAKTGFTLDTNQISYQIPIISLWDINGATINRSTDELNTLTHTSPNKDLSTDAYINEIDPRYSKTKHQSETMLHTKASSKLPFSKEITRTLGAAPSVQPELLISSSFSSIDVPSHLQPTVTLNSTINDLNDQSLVPNTMSRQKIRSPQDFSTPSEHTDPSMHHITARSLSEKRSNGEGTPIVKQESSTLEERSLENTSTKFNVISNDYDYPRTRKDTLSDVSESSVLNFFKSAVQSSSFWLDPDIFPQSSSSVEPYLSEEIASSHTLSPKLLSNYESLHLSWLRISSQLDQETKSTSFPSPSSDMFISYADPHLTVDIFYDKSNTATFQEIKHNNHSPVKSSDQFKVENIFITTTVEIGAETIDSTDIRATQVVMSRGGNLSSSSQYEFMSKTIQPQIESFVPATSISLYGSLTNHIVESPFINEGALSSSGANHIFNFSDNISSTFLDTNIKTSFAPVKSVVHISDFDNRYLTVETENLVSDALKQSFYDIKVTQSKIPDDIISTKTVPEEVFSTLTLPSRKEVDHRLTSIVFEEPIRSSFTEDQIGMALRSSFIKLQTSSQKSITPFDEKMPTTPPTQSLILDSGVKHEADVSPSPALSTRNIIPTPTSTKRKDLESVDSDFRRPETSTVSSKITPTLTSLKRKDPESIDSDIRRPKPSTVPSKIPSTLTSLNRKDPESIDSDIRRPKPSTVSSNITPTLTSLKRKDPESIDSDIRRPKTSTVSTPPSSSVRIIEPYSIDSDDRKLKPKTTSLKSTAFPNILTSFVPHSIKSSLPLLSHGVTSNDILRDTRTNSIQPDWLSTPLKMDPFLKSTVPSRMTSSLEIKPSQTGQIDSHKMAHESKTLFPTYTASRQHQSDEKVAKTDSEDKLISTRLDEGDSNDLDEEKVMASVMAVSSNFGFNHSRNASFSDGILKNEFTESTETDFPLPTLDTMLFKDNHYWVLTVLEAPVQGVLPENLSHSLEIRLANAYEEAFRRVSRRNRTAGEDKVVVKVLSVTNDLLLKQLEVIYVVERGGILMPATLLSNYLNFLRFEELRQFLGHHVILKAQPYRPSREPKTTDSNLPVLAIVCGILAFLLFSFCCLCIYCRCCRPKVPSTPMSSASASLQRSLEKYGQHNRKHLFREMSHQLTHEMSAHLKQEDPYLPQKPPSGRSLPTLPREDKALKILKIIEGKDGSSSPLPPKPQKSPSKYLTTEDLPKKRQQKPRKRRKPKQEVKIASEEQDSELLPVVPPKKFPAKHDGRGHSAESSTSWKPESSTPPVASSGKSSEEPTSDGSNTELLPPIEDLLDRKKAQSAAAEAETQMQLSRVRQRIADLLDDAFAMAGGKRITGSMRSKRVEPATNVFPRFGNLRSKSAAEADYLEKYENDSIERRPQSEGGQRIFGALTEEGQLITRPLPKLVWEEGQLPPMSVDRPLGELTEAHNHQCIHFFSFHHPHQQSRLVSPPQAQEATPPRELIPEIPAPFYLNQSDPDLQLALSPGIHPAAIDQYDEIDVVGSLRDGGENVAVLLRAIKEELQRFGSLPGESHA